MLLRVAAHGISSPVFTNNRGRGLKALLLLYGTCSRHPLLPHVYAAGIPSCGTARAGPGGGAWTGEINKCTALNTVLFGAPVYACVHTVHTYQHVLCTLYHLGPEVLPVYVHLATPPLVYGYMHAQHVFWSWLALAVMNFQPSPVYIGVKLVKASGIGCALPQPSRRTVQGHG